MGIQTKTSAAMASYLSFDILGTSYRSFVKLQS